MVDTNSVAGATDNRRYASDACLHRTQANPAYGGPVARPVRSSPAELVPGWPDTPSTEPDVETARRLALNLRAALTAMSLRDAKQATGVDHTTIADVLNGNTWPDLRTIARLEAGLRTNLWPTGTAADHRQADASG